MSKVSFVRSMMVCLMSLVLVSCTGLDETAEKGETSYPEARFPSYLQKPQSIEEIMPYAQSAVRQTGGRTPLGQIEPGKTVALFSGERALVEKGSTSKKITVSKEAMMGIMAAVKGILSIAADIIAATHIKTIQVIMKFS